MLCGLGSAQVNSPDRWFCILVYTKPMLCQEQPWHSLNMNLLAGDPSARSKAWNMLCFQQPAVSWGRTGVFHSDFIMSGLLFILKDSLHLQSWHCGPLGLSSLASSESTGRAHSHLRGFILLLRTGTHSWVRSMQKKGSSCDPALSINCSQVPRGGDKQEIQFEAYFSVELTW